MGMSGIGLLIALMACGGNEQPGMSPETQPAARASAPEPTGGQGIPALIEQLGDRGPAGVVEYSLAKKGIRAVPALIDALSSKDSWRRMKAADVLGTIGDSAAVPALIAMARQKGQRYESALDSLGAIGGPEAAAYLLEALPDEPMDVQPRVVAYLGMIGDNRAVGPLCTLLAKASSIHVRRQAAVALGRFRDPRSREALRKAVAEDRHWDVYMAAKNALASQLTGEPAGGRVSALVETVIEKEPEPAEGAEEWLRRYDKAHPAGPKAPLRVGPTIHHFVIPACYNAARQELLRRAGHPVEATDLVERLLGYMRSYQLEGTPGQKAMDLIVEIGQLAVPASQEALKRGDEPLAAHAGACLKKIAK
ncbi:MAG: HEAT repeat domain-containing protein [Planctomycetota bacterium]|nr:HEAT repeat domain-containing protein [Planctomycetota bacterium]